MNDLRLLGPDYISDDYNKIIESTHHTLNIPKIDTKMKNVIPLKNNMYHQLGLKYDTIKHLIEKDKKEEEEERKRKEKKNQKTIEKQKMKNSNKSSNNNIILTIKKLGRIGSVSELKEERYKDEKRKPYYHGTFGISGNPVK